MSDLGVLFVSVAFIVVASMVCKTVKYYVNVDNLVTETREAYSKLNDKYKKLEREYRSYKVKIPADDFGDYDEGG